MIVLYASLIFAIIMCVLCLAIAVWILIFPRHFWAFLFEAMEQGAGTKDRGTEHFAQLTNWQKSLFLFNPHLFSYYTENRFRIIPMLTWIIRMISLVVVGAILFIIYMLISYWINF